ncbi:TldD/PmbA family protein [Oceanibaculum indicum]|uniref:Putative peptidase, PmbA-like protein n=1 Tax=Oceanibaculum indicum P24 TaxID=1207063 RepID=K2JA93_9PROT|nr:metallopeptidase TldD-related protein [Oceanibaculum indicum]EKE67464.1 putative peptidase, PmbA-like protein [Oceanibaculum indicum P24]
MPDSQTDSLSLLADLIAQAKKAGADAADAVLAEGESLSHGQRLGKLEKIERAEGKDLGLRVFIGQRSATVSSTDFKKDALHEAVERAIAMAKLALEDKYAGIAGADQLARSWPEIDMLDPAEPTPEQLAERAGAIEEAALAVSGVSNSEGAEASWGRSTVTLVTSAGFAGRYARSSQGVSVSVIAARDGEMETDYDYTSAVYAGDLEDPALVGRRAGERTVRKLGPRKAKTAQVPVVFEPRMARSLVGHLLGAISGASVARGTSFLKDRMGQRIFAPGIMIVDDPHRPRGMRSKPFDGEGLANGKRNLIEDGVLTTWLLDLASARQLGLQSTGHAARGTGGPPSPSSSNTHLAAGNLSPEELIADIEQGFYVTEMMGSGANMVTGDYSRGAAGYWIEKGQIAYPVSEVTIAGNLKDMFAKLTPASDLEFKGSTDAPTVRIDGMTVAGS